jgi:hypothetical protein
MFPEVVSTSVLDTKFGEEPAAYTISAFNPISAIASVVLD